MENFSTSNQEYFANKEWLQARLGRFTASEIHKLFVGSRTKGEVFGQTALTYIRTKAAEILTQEVKDDIDFKQALWGKSNEPEAHKLFESTFGIAGNYYGASEPKFFPFGDYEGCSPDWESSDEKTGADFKCPFNSSEHVLNLMINSAKMLEDIRWEYYCQLQHSMLRRGWEKAFFVSYDPRMAVDAQKLKVVAVYPDEKWRNEFKEKVELATTELKKMINLVMKADFVIATHDPEVKATIIEPGILQKA